MKMRNAKYDRRKRAARSRALLILAGIVLFSGLFMQITMLARISSQSKQASSLEVEIEDLSAKAENLELRINKHYNLEKIAERALELGMEKPDETQIRVVSVAQVNMEDNSTQAAGNFAGENILE